MDNDARRSMDSHADCIGNRMIYPDKLHSHTAKLNGLSGCDHIELGSSKDTMFFKLALHKTKCKSCTINGNIKLFEEIRKSTDVILMSVGQDNTSELIYIFLNIRIVRKYDINSKKLTVRKSHSAVDNKHIV